MRLERLVIRRVTYGPNEGCLSGEITVSGDSVKMEITIPDEKAKAMVDLCADIMVDQAIETANIVKDDIIEHHTTPAIE